MPHSITCFSFNLPRRTVFSSFFLFFILKIWIKFWLKLNICRGIYESFAASFFPKDRKKKTNATASKIILHSNVCWWRSKASIIRENSKFWLFFNINNNTLSQLWKSRFGVLAALSAANAREATDRPHGLTSQYITIFRQFFDIHKMYIHRPILTDTCRRGKKLMQRSIISNNNNIIIVLLWLVSGEDHNTLRWNKWKQWAEEKRRPKKIEN